MSKNFKFSERLQQVHNESEEIISSHVKRLDSISSDIKILEDVLVKAGIPFKFTYFLKCVFDIFENTKCHFSIEWDKKRLVYKEIEGDEQGGSFSVKKTECTPLIETRSQIRISIEDELPVFYKKIIEHLEKDPLQSSVKVYSPNYKEESFPF